MRTDAIHRLADGRWTSILQAAGIDPIYLSGKHTPCPVCGGKDRFRYSNHENAGLSLCNVCGSFTPFQLIEHVRGVSFNEAKDIVQELAGEASPDERSHHQPDTEKLRKRLNAIRKKAIPAHQATQAQKYLATRCLPVPPQLEWIASLPYVSAEGEHVGNFPALVARVVAPDGTPLTYHRTYLQGAGKAPVDHPRKMMPLARQARGWAIRLYPLEGDELVIAEGIETAVACHELWGLPAWSVVSTTGMQNFIPPEGVRRVIVAGDNDANYAGQAAAYTCAQKLTADGYEVDVRIPKTAGDWADVLIEERRHDDVA